MKPKRKHVPLDIKLYQRLRGACALRDVTMTDALDCAVAEVLEKMGEGWRPPRRERDTVTGLGEIV